MNSASSLALWTDDIFHIYMQQVWIEIAVSKKVEIEMDDYLNLWVLDNVE